MTDDPINDPAVRSAVTAVLRSSASDPGSERFRLQLDQEFRNADINLSPEDLVAVQQAITDGRLA